MNNLTRVFLKPDGHMWFDMMPMVNAQTLPEQWLVWNQQGWVVTEACIIPIGSILYAAIVPAPSQGDAQLPKPISGFGSVTPFPNHGNQP